MNREELIEAAADAMFTANDGQLGQGYDEMARAALAVFEQAHTLAAPTDDEPGAECLDCGRTDGGCDRTMDGPSTVQDEQTDAQARAAVESLAHIVRAALRAAAEAS